MKKLETNPKIIWKHEKERVRPIFQLGRVSKAKINSLVGRTVKCYPGLERH